MTGNTNSTCAADSGASGNRVEFGKSYSGDPYEANNPCGTWTSDLTATHGTAVGSILGRTYSGVAKRVTLVPVNTATDFDPGPNREARIGYRIYAIRPLLRSPMDVATGRIPVPEDPLIASGELSFLVARMGLAWTGHPGYTRLDVSSIPAVQSYERIRIELAPLTQGLRYWAFVAVTNNETQHITTITP